MEPNNLFTTLNLEFKDQAELDHFCKALSYWAVTAAFDDPSPPRKNTRGLILALERDLPEWIDDMELLSES